MLSYEERLSLLKDELSCTSSAEVLVELQSYEPKGPLAIDFVPDTSLLKLDKQLNVIDLNTPEHNVVGFITLVDESYYFTPKTSGKCVTKAFNNTYNEQIENILKGLNYE